MLADFFSRRKTISSGGCIAQFFFIQFLGAAEIFLLMIMAYEHYVAICKPLHYASIVSSVVCCALVGAAWVGGFVHSIVQVWEVNGSQNKEVSDCKIFFYVQDWRNSVVLL
ncbi:unnamed protein product [Caretta caretta]